MELKSLWVMRCFWNGEKTVGAACAELPPLPACHFNPTPTVIKFTAETNTASHPESIINTVNSCSYNTARHGSTCLELLLSIRGRRKFRAFTTRVQLTRRSCRVSVCKFRKRNCYWYFIWCNRIAALSDYIVKYLFQCKKLFCWF